MNWPPLIGPAVVAAVISGLVSVIGIWISARAARRIHTEKLTFDREEAERRFVREVGISEAKMKADLALAERKFEFDKSLAEHKVNLDTRLAERKFTLDQALAAWRRRYEVAEQVLTAAYEARDALVWARGRGVFAGEGKTRTADQPEDAKLREARDSAYIPIERLSRNSKAFATLQALQDTVATHFGSDTIKPISTIVAAHNSIVSTASMLVDMASASEDHIGRQQLLPLRQALWGDRPDDLDRKVDAAIEQLEAICKPILSQRAPA